MYFIAVYGALLARVVYQCHQITNAGNHSSYGNLPIFFGTFRLCSAEVFFGKGLKDRVFFVHFCLCYGWQPVGLSQSISDLNYGRQVDSIFGQKTLLCFFLLHFS